MKASELIQCLETLAPPAFQESYDNSGLLVGQADAEVTGVLVSLDCTEAVVDEAIARGCNMVVSHHPIIFSGLKRLNGSNYVERTVMKALSSGVLLYAIHTNLDNVRYGVNGMIAEKLGLQNTRILAPKRGLLSKLVTYVPIDSAQHVREALWATGAGNISNYDQCSFNQEGTGTFRGNEHSNPTIGTPGKTELVTEERIELIFPKHIEGALLRALKASHPYEEVAFDIYPIENKWAEVGAGMVGELAAEMPIGTFLSSLKTSMNCTAIRHTIPHVQTVKKVAVCGGTGIFLLKDAIRSGADVFITSDLKYHQFFDADGRITLADIGHHESEQFTVDLLVVHLRRQFPTFAIRISEVNTNPIKYL